MILRKSNFTLLELLIVMAILAVAASAIGYGFMQERSQQQFINEIAAVQQKLQAAELLMQFTHETVTLVISKNEITLQTDSPLTPIFKHIFDEHKNLSTFSSVVFITPEEQRIEGKISLIFSAINQSIPRGTLLISRGAEHKSIVLTGYLQPIMVENGIKRVTPEEDLNIYPQIVQQEWEKRREKIQTPVHPS